IMSIALSILIWIALRPEILRYPSAGDLVAYITAAGLLSKPLQALTDINGKPQRGMAAPHSVFELLDMSEEKNPGTLTSALTGNFESDQANLVYAYGHHGMHDFSLNVKASEAAEVFGRSGAVKSSLVDLLVRLQELSSGQIKLDGFDVLGIELTSLRTQIAIDNQQVVLFNPTVCEKI
ncbi:ATP-binding cassette domain-containing protein, partial [Acinetobacter indicus]|uniref:ATP-binding cassette domain-containing protein n=1 Tax=Acinetobacter indicus TaxID=756892 RepID=UPI000AB9CC4C